MVASVAVHPTTTTSSSTSHQNTIVVIPSYRSIDIEPNDDDSNDNNNNNDYMSDSLHSSIHGNNNNNRNNRSLIHDVLLLVQNDDHDRETTNTVRQQQQQQQQQQKPLSMIAASLALMKGNLGPGILNLPHAFSKSGPTIGTIMFCIVTIQGLYSMTLLVYCKNQINLHHCCTKHSNNNHRTQQQYQLSPRQQQQQQQQQHESSVLVSTFMDITQYTMGSIGGKITEIFIFVLQLGVCCVFISLIATNLQVIFIHVTPIISVSCISLCMMIAITIFRYIHDLFWFNAIANTFMFIAILTATITSCIHIIQQQHSNNSNIDSVSSSSSNNDNDETTTTTIKSQLSAAITFTADMFFAFEGIGLVLPVENNYNSNSNNNNTRNSNTTIPIKDHPLTTATIIPNQYHRQTQQQDRRWDFSYVLLASMGFVATLFAIIGLTSSIAYKGNINNASITAYLKEYYPNILWYSIVNIMVLFAVALTFPLQLTPAMEVLEKWIVDDCCSSTVTSCCNQRRNHYLNYHRRFFTSISRSDSDDDDDDDGIDITNPGISDAVYNGKPDSIMNDTTTDHPYVPTSPPATVSLSIWNQYGWMFRRWMVVLTCAIIVLVVNNDLGLLVSLFGAVGQTGLAAMPCMVHLILQHQQHIAPKQILLSIADVLVIIFCAIVMLAGFYISIVDVITKMK